MLAPTCFSLPTGLGRAGHMRALAQVVVAVVDGAPPARPAPRPRARPLAAGLQGLLSAEGPLRDPAPVRAAAAAFSAGDGYLPGQLIDRVI